MVASRVRIGPPVGTLLDKSWTQALTLGEGGTCFLDTIHITETDCESVMSICVGGSQMHHRSGPLECPVVVSHTDYRPGIDNQGIQKDWDLADLAESSALTVLTIRPNTVLEFLGQQIRRTAIDTNLGNHGCSSHFTGHGVNSVNPVPKVRDRVHRFWHQLMV